MALPSMVPLADLLPVLVQRATLSGTPDSHRSRPLNGEADWVLQRLGGPPLDEDLTPTSLQIRDGETLYLRPRGAQLPPVHFDDLVDGLASGVQNRPDRWRDWMTRALFLALGAVTLITCLVLLLDDDLQWRGPLAAGIAVLAAIGATMCSRALDDGWAAVTLGLCALPFAAVAGYALFPAGERSGSAPLLTGAVALSFFALLVTIAVGQYRALFLSLSLTTVAAAALPFMVLWGLSGTQAAAAVVTGALLASVLAPSVAFRLALLRLPQLPTSSADLGEDIEPYPAPRIISGAAVADTYLTWLLVATGLICSAGLVIVAQTDGWVATWFVISVVAVVALRSRGLTSGWQRLATLLPAVLGSATLIIRYAGSGSSLLATTAVVWLIGTAIAMIALSRGLPGRRLLPYWGRIADIVEYLVAIAMVLLLLAMFDVYQWARALAG